MQDQSDIMFGSSDAIENYSEFGNGDVITFDGNGVFNDDDDGDFAAMEGISASSSESGNDIQDALDQGLIGHENFCQGQDYQVLYNKNKKQTRKMRTRRNDMERGKINDHAQQNSFRRRTRPQRTNAIYDTQSEGFSEYSSITNYRDELNFLTRANYKRREEIEQLQEGVQELARKMMNNMNSFQGFAPEKIKKELNGMKHDIDEMRKTLYHQLAVPLDQRQAMLVRQLFDKVNQQKVFVAVLCLSFVVLSLMQPLLLPQVVSLGLLVAALILL